MAIKVIVSQKAWNGFLRRAKKAFPHEHIEAVWGEETIDSFRITHFKKIKVDDATDESLEYDELEIKRQKWLAQKAGKEFLGTVHTHPHACDESAPSVTDHYEGAQDGEKIMGVVVIHKQRKRFVNKTNWWFPQRRIEFVVLPE